VARKRGASSGVVVAAEPWVLVAALLLMLAAHGAVAIGLLVGLALCVTPITNSIVAGSRVAACPDHLQGRVQASATVVSMAFAWVGPLAVGVLFQEAGATAAILALAGWSALFAVLATCDPAVRAGPPQPAAA
jgi:hypothetical protein